jgi:hypothetical protein
MIVSRLRIARLCCQGNITCQEDMPASQTRWTSLNSTALGVSLVTFSFPFASDDESTCNVSDDSTSAMLSAFTVLLVCFYDSFSNYGPTITKIM